MTTARRTSIEAPLGLIAAVVAVVWAIVVLDPLGAATIDPDASSSVLYFQHLVGGSRLEVFVPTTPKPLLTLVFGVTWSLLHDWRALVWETILVWGVAVGATAALTARVAGVVGDRLGWVGERGEGGVGDPSTSEIAALPAVAIGAGAFAAAALLASSDLLLEVSRGNSLVWALAGWAVAGLAATARPIRPRLAGFALLLASLCRFETFALTALAVVALIVWRRVSGRTADRLVPGIVESGEHFRERVAVVRDQPVRGAAMGIAIALLAVPIVLLHDWLLAGDPLYWLSVPSRYTTIFNPGLESIAPAAYAGTFVSRLAPEWPLLVLAAIGVIALARARLWLVLGGVAAVGLGVVALLFWLALRATYISNRYYEPIDLALVVAAAIGIGSLVGLVVSRPGRVGPRVLAPAAAAVGLVAGVVVMWPALPWDRRATTELTDVRKSSLTIAAAMPAIRPLAVSASASSIACPTRSASAAALLLVPSRDVARVAVETGACDVDVGNSYATLLNGGMNALQHNQVLLHDAAADRPVALYRPLEIDAPTSVGGVALDRIALDVAGTWLLRVR